MDATTLGWWGVPLAILGGAIRVGTPLLWVSLGETVTEKAGRINLGLEGTLLMGAMTAYAVSLLTGNPWLGIVAAAGLAGAVEVAAVHGAANASLIAGYGYSGILIAFAARFSPAGVVPAAILVGGIAASGSLLQRRLGLPDASVTVLLGFAFVALIGCETLRGRGFFKKG